MPPVKTLILYEESEGDGRFGFAAVQLGVRTRQLKGELWTAVCRNRRARPAYGARKLPLMTLHRRALPGLMAHFLATLKLPGLIFLELMCLVTGLSQRRRLHGQPQARADHKSRQDKSESHHLFFIARPK